MTCHRRLPRRAGWSSWWTGDGVATNHVGPNHGTLNNGVTFTQGEVAGCFQFNDNDYVSANTAGLPIGNANRTLEMWVKVNTFDPHESYFAGYGAFGSNNQTYQIGTVSDHSLYFSQWGQALIGPVLQAGQWYHIAATNVGNSVTLYLNGSAVATGNLTINTPSGTQFDIGRVPGSLGDTRKLDGVVDEVSVYNRALTADEIQTIYSAGSDGKTKSPTYVFADFPSVVEGSARSTTPVNFTIQRVGNLSGQAVVNWATADGTGTAGAGLRRRVGAGRLPGRRVAEDCHGHGQWGRRAGSQRDLPAPSSPRARPATRSARVGRPSPRTTSGCRSAVRR